MLGPKRALESCKLRGVLCWLIKSGLTQNTDLCREHRPGFFLREKGCQDFCLAWLLWGENMFCSAVRFISCSNTLTCHGGRENMYKLCLWQRHDSNLMHMWEPAILCTSQVRLWTWAWGATTSDLLPLKQVQRRVWHGQGMCTGQESHKATTSATRK